MHITLHTGLLPTEMRTSNGYGYATDRMLNALRTLGHEVDFNNPEAPVAIVFNQPLSFKWPNDKQYRILFLPWESTGLPPGWLEVMNDVDELWTPSDLIAGWFKKAGVTVPIFIYEHGVDPIWTKQPRTYTDTLKILSVGTEAARRSLSGVMNAFKKAFQGYDDVELVLKTQNAGWKIDRIGKMRIINRTLPRPELVKLHHDSHVFFDMSMGEGWGMSPHQALATGMPTIILPDWAPYRDFLDPRLTLEGELKSSPWHSTIHPGKMYRVSQDSAIDRLRFVYDHYDSCHTFAQENAEPIQQRYDWLALTKNMFENLEKRL